MTDTRRVRASAAIRGEEHEEEHVQPDFPELEADGDDEDQDDEEEDEDADRSGE